MFEDTDGDRPDPEDSKKSSGTMERWAHFPAGIVFGVLILFLHGYPWGWEISIAGGYTVYVFWLALGNDKQDLDDITGDTLIFRKIRSQLLPHLLILALIVAGVAEWFRLKPLLPFWFTQEGRKGSLWGIVGFFTVAFAGIAQGFWMSRRIKRQFREPDGQQN